MMNFLFEEEIVFEKAALILRFIALEDIARATNGRMGKAVSDQPTLSFFTGI